MWMLLRLQMHMCWEMLVEVWDAFSFIWMCLYVGYYTFVVLPGKKFTRHVSAVEWHIQQVSSHELFNGLFFLKRKTVTAFSNLVVIYVHLCLFKSVILNHIFLCCCLFPFIESKWWMRLSVTNDNKWTALLSLNKNKIKSFIVRIY